ncbi:MAG: hypothetical protein PUD80_05070 [Firmicutes bacterium]|nr:hypothetical protein [Bacillota bacterium]
MEQSFLLSRDGLKISCKLSQPEDGRMDRVVLGVHGFGGSADDAIQSGIAEEMSLFSAATVRFDFPAHGNSPMGSQDFSLKNCMDTLLAVAGFARERFAEVTDLCIFATGFGAYVTLLCLDSLLAMPGRVRLVVQTPSVRMDETLLAMVGMSRETFWAMDRFTIPAERPFDVTYRFYEELRGNSVMNTYPIPMLILHGEDDKYISMQDIREFHSLNEDSRLVIIPGASHRFLEDGAWDMVLDLTRDWFEFQQVLLADWD